MNRNIIIVFSALLLFLYLNSFYFHLGNNDKTNVVNVILITTTPNTLEKKRSIPTPTVISLLTIKSDPPGVQYPIHMLSVKPVVSTFFDGLQIMDVKIGSGTMVKNVDILTVNYTGWLTNGTKFDSSLDPIFGHVQPAQFPLSGVIEGWQQGLIGMQVGGIRRLYVPAALAYGNNPPSNSPIQAEASLLFEIELIGIP